MPVAFDSVSYPTLGALYSVYPPDSIPFLPGEVVSAAYWLTHTVMNNVRAGRRPIDMNHVEYKTLREFDLLPKILSDRLVINAVRSYTTSAAEATGHQSGVRPVS